jgi:hypothetical protein
MEVPVPKTSPISIERRAYTIAEFCGSFRVGRTKCNELMAAGILDTRHLGRRVLITAESAERWWNSLQADARRAA